VSTGVTVDRATRTGSWIMVASSLLYLIVQIPAVLGHQYSPAAALTGAVVCFLTLVAYCAYQVRSCGLSLSQKAFSGHLKKRNAIIAIIYTKF
jgi:hypothetical protein